MSKQSRPRPTRDDVKEIEYLQSREQVSQMVPLYSPLWERLIADSRKPAKGEKERPHDIRMLTIGRDDFDAICAAIRAEIKGEAK